MVHRLRVLSGCGMDHRSWTWDAGEKTHPFDGNRTEDDGRRRVPGDDPGAERKSARVKWMQADAEALPFPDGSFDGATMVLCAHPMQNIGKAFAAAFSGPDDWFQLFTGAEGRFWLREYSPGPWRRPAGRCRRSPC